MKLHTSVSERETFDSRETSAESILHNPKTSKEMYLETKDGLINTRLTVKGGSVLLELPRLVMSQRNLETAWKEDKETRWLILMAKNVKFCPLSNNEQVQKAECTAYCRLYDGKHEWKIAELVSTKRGSKQKFYFVYDPNECRYL